ncbi:MAG: DUF4390 domain-containing protein [Gammaproteobacteria bacterium]|nr:DUF4390 domain-containing protein [Gammaproteobacteria bacterium]
MENQQSQSKNNSFIHLCARAGLFLGLCMVSIGLHASDRFEVSHAQTIVLDDTYYLTADIAYALHDEAKSILQQGLPIRIELQAELVRPRRYWRDKIIARVNKLYLIQFNAVTERYVVSIPDLAQQESFATAEQAIYSLRTLKDIPLLSASNVPNPEIIQARARLVVDVRHFPDPLQYLAKYWADWVLVSEWYVWPLKL